MSNFNTGSWPDKPLIRIIEGYDAVDDDPIRDTLAIASSRPESLASSPHPFGTRLYTRLGGGLTCRGVGDVISAWEEMAAVPSAALADLRAAFEGLDELSPGMGVDGYRIDAVRAVLAYLPDA